MIGPTATGEGTLVLMREDIATGQALRSSVAVQLLAGVPMRNRRGLL